jgi:dTDP-D-glucose 4,6-dehydratase
VSILITGSQGFIGRSVGRYATRLVRWRADISRSCTSSLTGSATDAREASGLCGHVAGRFRKGLL